jgi:hypothetical protein
VPARGRSEAEQATESYFGPKPSDEAVGEAKRQKLVNKVGFLPRELVKRHAENVIFLKTRHSLIGQKGYSVPFKMYAPLQVMWESVAEKQSHE